MFKVVHKERPSGRREVSPDVILSKWRRDKPREREVVFLLKVASVKIFVFIYSEKNSLKVKKILNNLFLQPRWDM
jgi:hypothetical protein